MKKILLEKITNSDILRTKLITFSKLLYFYIYKQISNTQQ